MKVNFLLPGVRITGGVRVVFEYADRLSKRGHDVTILYPIIPPRMSENLINPRARVAQILGVCRRLSTEDNVDWFNLDTPIRQIPTLAPRFVKYFDHLIPDADVTIATAWETAYTVANLDSAKGEKAYFVQHYEIWDTWNSDEAWRQVEALADEPAAYPIEMYRVTPPTPKARRQKELVDRSYELPLSKITISSWLEELLESKFNQDVEETITNSVNHSTFYPDPTADKEITSILLPSRDTPWKGERETKNLIEEIGESYDVEIHMYGSIPEKSTYPDSVIQNPFVSDRKLRQLYSDADIFVLPSWVEGFGLPPMEAMACKCAVVATNVGAVPDYTKGGEVASVVPPRDSSALINAVEELIENSEKRTHLQHHGYKHIKKYTWDKATAKFEQTLRKLTEKPDEP